MVTPSIPEHYTKLYGKFIRFAILMIFMALLTGIAVQESLKKAPISVHLPPGLHIEGIFNASVVHGHIFLIGVLIPLAVLFMLQLSLSMNGKIISEKALLWGSRLYLPGAVLSLFLQLYRGYYYLLSIRQPQYDFLSIQHQIFGGNPAVMIVLYATAHTALSVGLGIFAVNIWKALPSRQSSGHL